MSDKIPARFRKTKSDKWAVMAPVDQLEKALANDGVVDVQKKSGEWTTFKIVSLGKPFEVDGVLMCYGYDFEDSSASAPPSTSNTNNATKNKNITEPPRYFDEPLPVYQGSDDEVYEEPL